MNMIKLFSVFSIMIIMFVSCTDIEKIEVEHVGGYNTLGDSEYYANLRAWKETAKNHGRPVAFGWFSDWAPTGPLRKGYLSSVPDSMDIISMWSGAPGRYEITPDQKKDKEFVQKVKGIKLLEVRLISYLGKGRTPESIYEDIVKQAKEEGWSDSKLEEEKKKVRWKFWGFNGELESSNHYESLARYAKALCDSLYTGEWDGYDIDWEIGGGVFDMDGTLEDNKHLIFLVKEMNKYIGPQSDPEGKGHKLLCIDGAVHSLIDDLDEYVDYWILQSYNNSHPNFDLVGTSSRKVIATANFEANFTTGGGILQQAAVIPKGGYKGGIGAYRFEKDYDNKPDYKFMRQAIQINQQVFNEWKTSQNK